MIARLGRLRAGSECLVKKDLLSQKKCARNGRSSRQKRAQKYVFILRNLRKMAKILRLLAQIS